MYNLPHFKANNQKEVIDFMHAHPFITLCGCDEKNKPVATHVPVLIEERGERIFFKAHIMRNQKHTKAFEHNKNVLAIFSTAHTYVSASWYSNQKTGSTWNYQSVHAHGILNFKDESFLHDLLTQLTEKFENNPHSPSLVQKLDEDYVNSMMKAITGFEIEINSIEHVFKLSQNRDEKSYDNIVQRLKQQEGDAKEIGELMEKRKDQVFK